MLNPFSLMPNRKQLIDLVNSIVAEVNQLINGKADKTELDKKLDKTGGNVTGDLSVNGEKVAINSKLSMPSKQSIIVNRELTNYTAPTDGWLNAVGFASGIKGYYSIYTGNLRVSLAKAENNNPNGIILPMCKGAVAYINTNEFVITQLYFIPAQSAESEVN